MQGVIVLLHLCCYFTVSQAFVMQLGHRLVELKQAALWLPLVQVLSVLQLARVNTSPQQHTAPQHALKLGAGL